MGSNKTEKCNGKSFIVSSHRNAEILETSLIKRTEEGNSHEQGIDVNMI